MANKRLSAVITIGGAVASSLGSAFGAVTRETNKVGQAIAQLTARQRQLNAELARVGRDGNNAASLRVQYAQQELRTIERQLVALARRKSLEDASEKNLAMRAKLRSQIGDTVAMGAAVLLPAGAALKKSADFNYTMQDIGNTANMTKAEILSLGREILKISDETGKSAKDVQGAMGFLVRAGMEVGTASQVLRQVGRTATATASEIEDVAKATFTLNDALKVQPRDMQRALDMLVQAGKEGNFEFKDMAAELPVLAAGMQALKMTGAEAVGTLGAALQIARKGAGNSSEAATNVQNFLAKVLSPETLKKASKNFGVDLYKIITTAQKSGKNPFEAAIAAIFKMTKGGDQKLLGDLFQDMQVQNFLRPMLQNMEEYQRIKQAAMSAQGVTDRDFLNMTETTKQAMNDASNAVGRLAIAIGNSLEPVVGKLLAVFTPLVKRITEFVENNSTLIGAVVAGAASLLAFRVVVLGLGFALTFVKGAVIAIGLALTANPIGLAIRAIALAAGLIYVYWEPIKKWFGDLWDWIIGKVQALIELKNKVVGLFSNGNQSDLGGGYDAMGNATGAMPDVENIAGGGTTTVQDNSTNTYHITQQPGQDAKALAEEITRLQRKSAGVRARSSLVDGVGAQ